MNYCGFNIEPFCSDVCGNHRRPQTLAEICRNMDICCGFRAVAAREKSPGLILLWSLISGTKMFPFIIIFKQIHVVRLWTCRNKHFLNLLCVFVTNDIVKSEHEMSTAKSLRYNAPIAPVSKCQPQKNGEKRPSVLVLHSYYPEWDHALLWLCPFTRILWHFLIHLDWCLSPDSLLLYSSKYLAYHVYI